VSGGRLLLFRSLRELTGRCGAGARGAVRASRVCNRAPNGAVFGRRSSVTSLFAHPGTTAVNFPDCWRSNHKARSSRTDRYGEQHVLVPRLVASLNNAITRDLETCVDQLSENVRPALGLSDFAPFSR